MAVKDKDDIIYVKSDIFQATKERTMNSNIVIPHVCNNINGFGAGFAGDVAYHYPEVKANFHMLGAKSKLGHVQYISAYKNKRTDNQIIFANMIAQNGIISLKNKRPLNYIALAYCLSNIKNYITDFLKEDSSRYVEIHAPKFGSGLSGGNWNFIKSMIQDSLSQYTTFIYIK